MKSLLIALACTLTFACATEEKASFSDAQPTAVECADCEAGACTGDCSAEMKAECSGESEPMVCPVTGKVQG